MQSTRDARIESPCLWAAACLCAATLALPAHAVGPAEQANELPATPDTTAIAAGANQASPGAPINTNGNLVLNAADLAGTGDNRHKVYVTYTGTYDDNLFRIPDGALGDSLLAPGFSRSDWVNSGSVGFDGQWTLSRQIFDVNAHVDGNRFVNNGALNNTAYAAAGVWDWVLSSRLTGQAGADMSRQQASFAALRFLGRDMVSIYEYFVNGRFQIGPHWALVGQLRDFRTLHSADETKVNDYHSKTGNAGVEFDFSAVDSLTFNYHYTKADYANETVFLGAPFNSDYDEDRYTAVLHYVISPKTLADVTAGYVHRNFVDESIGAFSGVIWRVAAAWLPTDKFRVDAVVSRDLQAFLDAQSDYFVAKTVSIAPVYLFSEKIRFTLTAARTTQDYSTLADTIATTGSRHDTITSEKIGMDYVPIPALTLNLSAGYEKRSSTDTFFEYKDATARVTGTFKFF